MNTMSSSTFSVHPSMLDKSNRDSPWSAGHHGTTDCSHSSPHLPSTTSYTNPSFASNHLSPYSHIHSNSASPILNASTPADSFSAFSEQFPLSDYSTPGDPFFGVDFNDESATPAFLNNQSGSIDESSDNSELHYLQATSSAPDEHAPDPHTYPLSPDPTTPAFQPKFKQTYSPTLGLTSPESMNQVPSGREEFPSFDSAFTQFDSQPQAAKRTNTCSSEEGMAPITAPVPSPSPRVTVSMWGRDQGHFEKSFAEDTGSPSTMRAAGRSADDTYITPSYQRGSVIRNESEPWASISIAGLRGWAPENRVADEGASMNELDTRRKIEERNQEVDRWIADARKQPQEALPSQHCQDDEVQDGDERIPLGSQTENKPLPGQTYYMEGAGALTEADLKLMREQHPAWSDPPMAYPIRQGDSESQQPESSAAAMARFEQMCQETGSVLSRSATWGTRRRSLPSIADIEGITSGNFLKKLSISRERRPSILFRELRGLVRRPSASQLLKRHRSVTEEEWPSDQESQTRRESRDTLAPPSRTSSWTKKQQKNQVPSLNTALVSMATGAATIGTMHARTTSISNVTSPKSPFGTLSVHKANVLRRPRSKSDLPKGGNGSEESHPNLVGMWKKSGGPPVAQLARAPAAAELDDDDDEDEESYEESDAKPSNDNFIDSITPNMAGFKQQVLKLNPKLAQQNTFLVDRIAYQQVLRYKSLVGNRIKHMRQTSAGLCQAGLMCIASGGAAVPLDVKGDGRGMDPLSASYEAGSDGDATPLEGAVTTESFPQDIPLPPTGSLPAEFECQLCYAAKKFIKPSDWTKHVHEDVQPFTCTWDKCREPKMFKRKADWVRHENEGHRHLEWWKCDVDDCRHVCYRRDNFLQHLVREHKFIEPKIKTKAAIKRAGAAGQDPTWARVEACHAETQARPQDEPCRFCGKTLPSWKKLTVHLAKHMETLALPVLRLVARKELDADTIISPVQEPPPRTFPVQAEMISSPYSSSLSPNPGVTHSPGGGMIAYAGASQHAGSYNTGFSGGGGFSSFYDTTSSAAHTAHTATGGLGLGGMHQPLAAFQDQTAAAAATYQSLPVLSSGGTGRHLSAQYIALPQQQIEVFPAYSMGMNALGLQDACGVPIYDTIGQQQPQPQQQQYQRDSLSPFSRSPHQGQDGFYQG